jgi:hypothetical protein
VATVAIQRRGQLRPSIEHRIRALRHKAPARARAARERPGILRRGQGQHRATLSRVQLVSYYDGYAEITALRNEERERLGKTFSVKDFNNRFLSYGSAPVRLIRELMREGD